MSSPSIQLKPLTEVGINLRKLGIYMLVEIGLTFMITLVLVFSLFSLFLEGYSEEALINLIFFRIRIFFIIVSLIAAVELVFIYLIITSLKGVTDEDIPRNSQNKTTQYFFIAYVIVALVSKILGWLFIDQLLNGIQDRIYAGSEEITNYLSEIQTGGLVSQISGLITASLLFFAYNSLHTYISSLGQEFNLFQLNSAADKLNFLRIGAGLSALSVFLAMIVPEVPISGLFSFAGTILILIGLISGGGNLSKLSQPFSPTETRQWMRDTYITKPQQETSSVPQPQANEDQARFCYNCGSGNMKSARFCIQCGTNIEREKSL